MTPTIPSLVEALRERGYAGAAPGGRFGVEKGIVVLLDAEGRSVGTAASVAEVVEHLARCGARPSRQDRPHRHRAVREYGPLPFSGPVSRDERPAAHGNVSFVDECACGFHRRQNINGRHCEIGRWYDPPRFRP